MASCEKATEISERLCRTSESSLALILRGVRCEVRERTHMTQLGFGRAEDVELPLAQDGGEGGRVVGELAFLGDVGFGWLL